MRGKDADLQLAYVGRGLSLTSSRRVNNESTLKRETRMAAGPELRPRPTVERQRHLEA